MPEPLPDLIDSVRARLLADLDAQLGPLAERHHQALTEARRAADSEAELRWSRQVDAARAEGEQRASEAARYVTHETKHGLLQGIREIDAAHSITDALTAIVRAAAHEAPRTALFLGSGEPLEEWVVDGAPSVSDRDQAAVAIPLLLDGAQVAILYGHDDEGIGAEGWRDGVAVIASHGASRLASITATSTAQAMRWLSGRQTSITSAANVASVTSALPPSSDEEEQAARRYARLLLSEIKLYNEAAVRVGCEQRDLERRLAADIDRARRLYEQRVPATVAGREEMFHNELVQTLAGGDRSLLG